MEIEWIRENMETEQVFPLQAVQIAVETEAALPGGLREEARVLHADALSAVSGGEWAGGRAAVDGKVTFHVLYTQGDMDRVRSLEATADFSQSMTAEGALPAQAAVHPRAEVIGVSVKAFNGRVLLRAALQLSGDAAVGRAGDIMPGLADVPGVGVGRVSALPAQPVSTAAASTVRNRNSQIFFIANRLLAAIVRREAIIYFLQIFLRRVFIFRRTACSRR